MDITRAMAHTLHHISEQVQTVFVGITLAAVKRQSKQVE
jgi:hypothetical protein